MTFIKLNPAIEQKRLTGNFDDLRRLIGNQAQSGKSNKENYIRIYADIFEDENNVALQLELPGVSKEDTMISLNNERKLTIKGEKKRKMSSESVNILRIESSVGKFERSFILANDLDESNISANFNDGLLTLLIPKKKTIENEKLISIN